MPVYDLHNINYEGSTVDPSDTVVSGEPSIMFTSHDNIPNEIRAAVVGIDELAQTTYSQHPHIRDVYFGLSDVVRRAQTLIDVLWKCVHLFTDRGSLCVIGSVK